MSEQIQALAVAAGGYEVAPNDFLFRQEQLEKFAALVAAERKPLTAESIEQAIGYRLPEYAMQALLKLINTPKEDT